LRRQRPARLDTGPASETERLVAWLRLPAIALIVSGHGLAHPNPDNRAFFAAVAVFAAWSAAVLVYVYLREVTVSFSVLAIAVDVAAITTLALLSGGAFSQARVAYFLVPIAVAFRFRPSFTAVAAASTTVAYVLQASLHPAARRPEAPRFIAVYAGYLLWVGAAAVLLSYVLARRTERVAELGAEGRRLMADALSAEQRERQTLAEGLHDSAIQNLLSVAHELQEIDEEGRHPALRRSEAILAQTVDELREAMFELHPYVLEHVGPGAAIASIGRRAARQGGFRLHYELPDGVTHRHDGLLVSVASELLANAAKHSGATDVSVRLAREDGDVVLLIRDNGRGFELEELPTRLANGHIGLASHRVRIETAGGRLELRSAPGLGTVAEVRLPDSG
jgi:two-component system, NarL family, sensor kinase